MKTKTPPKKARKTSFIKTFLKKVSSMSSNSVIAGAAFVIVFGGVGGTYLLLTHAQSVSYYKGNCTQTTVGSGSSGACVQQAQDLLDALEHVQISEGHSYRTATGPGSGVFQYGSNYYLLMDGSYGDATANAVSRLSGSGTLSSGTSSSAGWQVLCRALVQYGLNKNSGEGASKLKFGTASGLYTNSATYVIFQSTCGSITTQTTSTGTSTTSSTTGKVSGTAPSAPAGTSSSSSSSGSSSSSTTTAASGGKCTSYTFSTASNNAPNKTLSGDCIYYIQTILNGAWASNPYSYLTAANNYDRYYNQSSGPIAGVSKTDNNYNQKTEVRIMALQSVMAYNGTPLSVTGTTDASTWGALCALVKTYGATPNTAAIQSARQVATNSANSDSGCSSITGKISSDQHQTTPPPLKCPSGSAMNSAKTSCSCPSGETYISGTCQKPAVAIPNNANVNANANGNNNASLAGKVTSFSVTGVPWVGGQAVFNISWASQNTVNCGLILTNTSGVTLSSSGGGASSGTVKMYVTKPHAPFTVRLHCGSKYFPNDVGTAADSNPITVTP